MSLTDNLNHVWLNEYKEKIRIMLYFSKFALIKKDYKLALLLYNKAEDDFEFAKNIFTQESQS